MGNCHRAAKVSIFSQKAPPVERKIAVFGLDGGGKTALCYALTEFERRMKEKQKPNALLLSRKKGDERIQIYVPPPTTAVVRFHYSYKHSSITLMDHPGGQAFRSEWDRALEDYDEVIFVIDSVDNVRFALACESLRILYTSCERPGMKIGTILILFTKIDFDNHLSENQWEGIARDCCSGRLPFEVWPCDYQIPFLSKMMKWMAGVDPQAPEADPEGAEAGEPPAGATTGAGACY